uniref:Endoplasmic reticulum resident protein 27 n=1 Tax=Jaculus jaculus TaxID=51337 RepID=A0A8C5NZW0_JACJA
MEAARCRYLILLLITACRLIPEVAADIEEVSDGPSDTQGPIWLTDVPAAVDFIAASEIAVIGFFQDLERPVVSIFHSMAQHFQDVFFGMSNSSEVLAHYNITSNTICLFRLVDNEQLRIEGEDLENMDTSKLSRFIETNSLRLVTEYSPMTVLGLFNSMIERHLLLVMNKASAEYEESMSRYRQAAELFQGEILFVFVDSGKRENGKVISYFKLKESQLPALAIYQTLDDKWDTLSITEVTVEQVKGFCDGFLQGRLLREDHKSEENTPKEEL